MENFCNVGAAAWDESSVVSTCSGASAASVLGTASITYTGNVFRQDFAVLRVVKGALKISKVYVKECEPSKTIV